MWAFLSNAPYRFLFFAAAFLSDHLLGCSSGVPSFVEPSQPSGCSVAALVTLPLQRSLVYFFLFLHLLAAQVTFLPESLCFLLCQWDQCYLPCPGAGPIKKSNAVTATEGLALGCSVHLPCLPPCPVPGPHTRCPGLGVPPRCLQGEAQSPAQGDVHGPQSHKTRPPIPTVTASVTLKVKAQPYVCLLSMGCISAKTHQDLLVWTCRGPRASVASLLSGC